MHHFWGNEKPWNEPATCINYFDFLPPDHTLPPHQRERPQHHRQLNMPRRPVDAERKLWANRTFAKGHSFAQLHRLHLHQSPDPRLLRQGGRRRLSDGGGGVVGGPAGGRRLQATSTSCASYLARRRRQVTKAACGGRSWPLI